MAKKKNKSKTTSKTSKEKPGPKVSLKKTVYALEEAADALKAALPKHQDLGDKLSIEATRAQLRITAKILRAKCYEIP